MDIWEKVVTAILIAVVVWEAAIVAFRYFNDASKEK